MNQTPKAPDGHNKPAETGTECTNTPPQGVASMPSPEKPIDFQGLPTLWRDPSFQGMAATQFFGAFNDNLFKQLMLLLALALPGIGDMQGTVTVMLALPFVLFSGFAGYLSDRYAKKPIIVMAKVAEIVCMGLGMVTFFSFGMFGMGGLFFVLFLMGTQSAFFGPGKYGILPEMLRESDLPRANGIILMLTFMAIIFGTITAGGLLDFLYDKVGDTYTIPREGVWRMWIASAVCILIAVAGTVTSLLIRRTPVANRNLQFSGSALAVPGDMRKMLKEDVPLSLALLASCTFWLIAAIVALAVNTFGVNQLGLSFGETSYMMACISIGIAVGGVIAGRACRGRADFRIVRIGAWGLLGCLILMSLSNPAVKNDHLLGQWGSLPVLFAAGIFAGMFAIPVQVFIQSRPPADKKGRMIAVMNQANFVAILLSGVIYTGFAWIVTAADFDKCILFALTALLMAPVAIFYRPKNDN